MTSDERCLTNMGDVHTCPIGGVDLVRSLIGFARVELAHLARQMIRGPSIHVPVGVDGEGLSVSLQALRRQEISHDGFTLIVPGVLAVVAESEKTSLESTMTLGGKVAFVPA